MKWRCKRSSGNVHYYIGQVLDVVLTNGLEEIHHVLTSTLASQVAKMKNLQKFAVAGVFPNHRAGEFKRYLGVPVKVEDGDVERAFSAEFGPGANPATWRIMRDA